MGRSRSAWHVACRWSANAGMILLLAATGSLAAPASNRMPSLVADARAQFDLAFRLHPTEAKARRNQLNAVVATWQAAPQTDANQEMLNVWLRAAIRASMPGSREPLPAPPDFAVSSQPAVPAANPAPVPVFESAAPAASSPSAKPSDEVPTLPEPAGAQSVIVSPAPTPAAKTPSPSVEKNAFDPFVDDPADQAAPDSK